MRASERLAKHRNDILRVAYAHGVTFVAVFGAIARGDDTDHDIIELVVTYPATPSLEEIVELEKQIVEAIGEPADVISSDAHGMEEIVREARPL
ncbi:nucleotidyltransferase family protein [Leifsonia sp. Leaf264]|uniref:nucleotidyltransferase family protein n=1 Tax=Leifsonia sp. Leaf264 TaxID=1736314 RepID=UPI0006FF3464|nr:hypothetical protein [Leifsonia sp. Leaf264]KQO98137.1 hypothetical protein ASF30_08680 [Leifsonia sp. Leaf264]